MRRAALALALSFAAALPVAAESWRVASPDGRTVAIVDLTDGAPTWRVERDGAAVIAPSELGFRFRDRPDLSGGLTAGAPERRSVDQTWTQPWGEVERVRDRHEELRLPLRETGGAGRGFTLVFRVFDEGVGFRYEVPAQAALNGAEITEELTRFRFAMDGTAFWSPARDRLYNEQIVRTTPLTQVVHADTPFTVKARSGLHLAVHEAALVDFAAMTLKREADGAFRAVLPPGADGIAVRTGEGFRTPWRTIQLADRATGLIDGSLMTLNLNEPPAEGSDWSWVRPSRYVGIWWAMHLKRASWEPGPTHGATTANTRRHIDFAAANGFDGVLVEGWNVGWASSDGGMDYTRAYPDFDLEGLTAYARSKDVRLIGHHETYGAVAAYERQMEAAFDLYARVGVDTVKTGYVAEDGRLRLTDETGREIQEFHDGQRMVRHFQRVLEEAAERRIAINTHEPVKDTGLRRTWPNWVSREGARGQEFNAWGDPGNPPEHVALLPFTRMLAGPMDFTPGIVDLSLGGNPKNRIPSTLAQQLALYVVLYSPVQMAADLPENYARAPQALRFIRQVPVDWSETRALSGEIGEHVAIARRSRGGRDWWIGAVTDETGRTLDVPLDFLPAGRWRAEIWRDGEGAHWTWNPQAMRVETRTVSAGERLKLELAPGGGAAVRLVPVT